MCGFYSGQYFVKILFNMIQQIKNKFQFPFYIQLFYQYIIIYPILQLQKSITTLNILHLYHCFFPPFINYFLITILQILFYPYLIPPIFIFSSNIQIIIKLQHSSFLIPLSKYLIIIHIFFQKQPKKYHKIQIWTFLINHYLPHCCIYISGEEYKVNRNFRYKYQQNQLVNASQNFYTTIISFLIIKNPYISNFQQKYNIIHRKLSNFNNFQMAENHQIIDLNIIPAQSNQYITRFASLIKSIQKSHWKEAILEASKTLNIKLYILDKLTPQKIYDLYQMLAQKFYNQQKVKTSWHQNELRIFVWILITYSAYKKRNPDVFQMEDWEYISSYFMKKSVDLCKFQYYSLKKLEDKHDKWSEQQDQMLITILNEKQIKNKWNQIAKQLFNKSDHIYFRTAKQCRQRWNNYLDPEKIKGNWTRQEDLKLIKMVLAQGKKWSSIAKELKNTRTEHMVKNRYKSLLSRQNKKSKRYKKYFNEILILEQIQRTLTNPNTKLDYQNKQIKKKITRGNKKGQKEMTVKIEQQRHTQTPADINKKKKEQFEQKEINQLAQIKTEKQCEIVKQIQNRKSEIYYNSIPYGFANPYNYLGYNYLNLSQNLVGMNTENYYLTNNKYNMNYYDVYNRNNN